MKIISGSLRGKNFYMPKGIRPTQNMVRKALFDLIGQDLEGLSFVDLFAGSGAMGFEAISRGANEVYFVEANPEVVKVLENNISLLNINTYGKAVTRIEVFNADSFASIKVLERQKKKFDLVFADPPYIGDLAKKTLKTLNGHDIVHANSFIIIQHDKKEILPEEFGRIRLLKRKNYGHTILSIYQVKTDSLDKNA